MEVFANYLGGTAFEVTARGHRVISDQPVEHGGADAGMTPPEFLLAALASCAAYYAAEYLKARDLPANALKVRVSAEKALRPARLSSFRIEVDAPGLDEKNRAGVLLAVHSCLVHNTLLGSPSVEVAMSSPASPPIQSEAEPAIGNAYRI
jgi:uncharacterized OsmC-like protein